jgi:hypothetical protein
MGVPYRRLSPSRERNPRPSSRELVRVAARPPSTVNIRRPWGGVLEGEKGNLPVQTRRKYELIINLKTAKTFGVELPASVLARADEGIK